MKITDSKINNSYRIPFEAIIIPDRSTCSKILRGSNEKQLIQLKTLLLKQKSNPVGAIISSKNNRLQAKLFCEYRIKNFKENYKQLPFWESNINFIKRICKICDTYKQNLDF